MRQMTFIKHFILAIVFFISGCTTTTYTESSKVVIEHPKPKKSLSAAETSVSLGIQYLLKRDLPKAKLAFLRALQQNPRSPEAWYSMAYYLEVTGDSERAGDYYLRAISVAPKLGEARNDYGTYLCRHARYLEAIQQFVIAAREPSYLYSAEAYENAGLCALSADSEDLAKDYFLKALEHNPNMKNALIELARLYYKEGDPFKSKLYLLQFNKLSKPTPESETLENRLIAMNP